MNFPSIRIEGAILSPDVLEKTDSFAGQKPADFNLATGTKVKDEIARAWADAQDYWRIFQRKLGTLREGDKATTETRNLWIVPLLGLLRYDIEFQSSVETNGKKYAISHRVTNCANTQLQIVGYNDPLGLDKKPQGETRKMSAHALVQEFLNLDEQLYGVVTNGHVLRLLRDSSRLIKLSYLEFDLDRIFNDGLFADFAILYRLLHATRLPQSEDTASESLIEQYHQDSLESGARIRTGLSTAVEDAIIQFGNGFLSHPDNEELRQLIADDRLKAKEYYAQLLRLIYRLLFLMVTEERDLIFPPEVSNKNREIYRQYYSVHQLRLLSEKRYLADHRRHDLWLALRSTFQLFEDSGHGEKIEISPLAGELFSADALNTLCSCTLGNDVLLKCLRSLSVYEHPDNKQLIRVNYAGLNVEEFGSVYEGLLEYEPVFLDEGAVFGFQHGDERAATGSHYTPDELVQPLIKHSLDYLIADRLKDEDPESALLNLRVADITCGSGHILLAAARRIATELAIVRTSEDQPAPPEYRRALRDVIRNCIYAVDLNPLAVELCKVAMWLEAHNPGQPLNFLDHHIKCGNAIVGYARREDVEEGVPDEAFKKLTGDNGDVVSDFKKRNEDDRKIRGQRSLDTTPEFETGTEIIVDTWNTLSALPEDTPHQIEQKRQQFEEFAKNEDTKSLHKISSIPIAQFYIPKTEENRAYLVTDSEFGGYWRGENSSNNQAVNAAWRVSKEKNFFHWFLEFPEIMERGGFDCILGNPPYLGGQALSGTYGKPFCELMKWKYARTGLSDLVVFCLRRIFDLLQPSGFTSIITTNSITDGDIRKDGLAQIVTQNGDINMAVRGIKWPGAANLVVSLLSIHKGEWNGEKFIDGEMVSHINTYFEEGEEMSDPINLQLNLDTVFQGSIYLGDGFLLTHDEANRLCDEDEQNRDVIMPVINGKELNNNPDQSPGRKIICFWDWSLEKAKKYPLLIDIVENEVKPERLKSKDKGSREKWWLFHRPHVDGYNKITNLPHCFAVARTSKYLSFSSVPTNIVFTDALFVFTTDRWDLFTVVHSNIHEVWARKYSGSLKQDLRYSPSNCFDNFAFPENQWETPNTELAEIGERYHAHRKALMRLLWLGLTKVYNLFHAPTLKDDLQTFFDKRVKDDPSGLKIPEEHRATALAFTYEEALEGILKLRELHKEMDITVRDAYGWQDLDLEHGFHDVETLAENDRTRYTISYKARRELLWRLLQENHKRASQEAAVATTSSSTSKKKTTRKKKPKVDKDSANLFN